MSDDEMINFLFVLGVIIIPPLFPFILWEMAVNKQVVKEQKAMAEAGVTGQVVDKCDIGYWHGLLQQGAISEKEYQQKKKELL
ncbi:MAG: SHOCT domain-containing protein [Campylobacterota bacterium]|nr:SHOCT domain-containing protein [Campylobacterota bacterium]